MDTVTLKSLSYTGYHGYYENERTVGNQFEVDVTFYLALKQAAENDDLDQTIDYAQAESTIAAIIEGESVKLVETLAKRIGDQLFATFQNVEKIDLAVRKLHPPMDRECEYAEIRMTWNR